MTRAVVLSDHDTGWAAGFERERKQLDEAFVAEGVPRPAIEHIGSTAVPGIRAKPIIDIMVGVVTYEPFELYCEALEALGYDYDRGAVHDEPNREVFRKGPDHLRTHHLHLTLAGGAYWTRILAFRDYLRAHPATAAEYERLKQRLAVDGRSYTVNKGPFVRAVEALAMQR